MYYTLVPAEVLFRIFSYLEAKDLVCSTSSVCHYWYEFSQDDHLWKRLSIQHWGFLKRTHDHLLYSWKAYFRSNFEVKNLSFLVIGAEADGEKDERLEDVKSRLIQCGLPNVDIFNARLASLRPGMLNNYNAVLFFSYHGFNQQLMGDMLAQYVDDGGGVVVATYSNCGRGNRLEGRWKDGNYDPIQLGTTCRTKALQIGKADMNHPVLHGVKSFSGGAQSSHGDGAPHPKADVVAEWDNGKPLISVLNIFKGIVMSLNFYPPSATVAYGGWDSKTDGSLIIANSLMFVTVTNRM